MIHVHHQDSYLELIKSATGSLYSNKGLLNFRGMLCFPLYGVSSAVGHKSKSRLAQCHPGLDLCPGDLISGMGLAADLGTWPSSGWPRSSSWPMSSLTLKVNRQVDHSKTAAHLTRVSVIFYSFFCLLSGLSCF